VMSLNDAVESACVLLSMPLCRCVSVMVSVVLFGYFEETSFLASSISINSNCVACIK